MKRLLLFLLVLLPFISKADTVVTIDDITYDLDPEMDNAAMILRADVVGDVVIPETIVSNNVEYTVLAIGESAFEDCSLLNSITIPNSVLFIGKSAFRNCNVLRTVVLPNSLMSIEDFTFYGCDYLRDINIPSTITRIGEWAFHNCSLSGTLTIPESVTEIDMYAFHGNFITTLNIPNSVTHIGELAFADCSFLSSVTLPNSVKDVGWRVFESCDNLPVIDGIRYADTYLVEVVDRDRSFYDIKEGTRFIESKAFAFNTSLANINIPNSVIGIGYDAFYGCTNLPVIDGVMYADTYLVESVDKNRKSYNIKEGTRFIGENAFNYLYHKSDTVTINYLPRSVISIERGAFADITPTKDARLIIPNTVIHLERGALPPSQYTVFESGNARYDTNSGHIIDKETCTLIDGFKGDAIGIPSYVTTIGSEAFAYNEKITTFTTPTSLESIDAEAFYGCSRLTTVYLGGNINIHSKAFGSCRNLTTVNTNTYIVSIYSDAFSDCKSLPVTDGIRYAGNYLVEVVDKSKSSYKIKEGTSYILGGAFKGCTNLSFVTIPKSVRQCSDAFSGCNDVKELIYEDGCTTALATGLTKITSVTIPNTVRTIGNNAFFGCTELTSVTIPNSVTRIETGAFRNCTNLTTVTIPNSVTRIDKEAFYGCTSLTAVNIPNSVKFLSDELFRGCTSFTSFSIPSTIKGIGRRAFTNCTNLISVEIPSSVQIVGIQAFYGDNNLTLVNNHRTEPQKTYYSTFSTYGTLHVPTGSADLYREADTWKNFTIVDDLESEDNNIIKGSCGVNVIYSLDKTTGVLTIEATDEDNYMYYYSTQTVDNIDITTAPWYKYNDILKEVIVKDGVRNISNCAFYGCSNITSVSLPNSVQNIGSMAFDLCKSLVSINLPESLYNIEQNTFYGCSSLTSITIPNSVEIIEYRAFYNCSSLTSIIIPNSVTTLGGGVFQGCSNLTSATLSNSLTSIKADLFSGCRKLSSISIPNSVTSIGEYAFGGCSELTLVTIPNSVTSIGKYAFSRCTNLTSITIPDKVESISDGAFYRCENLKEVYCYAEEIPTTGTNLFFFVYTNRGTLYVPSASLDAYKATAPWSSFGTILPIKDEIATGMTQNAGKVKVNTDGGCINISGLDEGTIVTVYSLNGTKLGTATATNGTVQFANIPGEAVIINAGGKNIKVKM